MNTTEHLEKIKAKCRELKSSNHYSRERFGAALLDSTIAAIDGLLLIAEVGQEPERGAARYDLNNIIAAWPEELL